MGYYLTTRQDVQMYLDYVFDGNNYQMELEFRERLATAYRKAYETYGESLRSRRHHRRSRRVARRNGYSIEFARQMNLSVAA